MSFIAILGMLVGSPGATVVDAADPPPFCQGRKVEDHLFRDVCNPSYPNSDSDDFDLLIAGDTNGGTLTIEPAVPACTAQAGVSGFTPSPCYSGVEFDFSNSLSCAYLDSFNDGTSFQPRGGRLIPCDFYPSDHLGPLFGNYIYKEIGFSTEPGWDLGLLQHYTETARSSGEICRSRFNTLYAAGAPGGAWEPDLTCEFPVKAPLPVEGLMGPTWIGVIATLTVEESTAGGPVDLPAKVKGWISVSGSERARRPIAQADSESFGRGIENCNKHQLIDESRSHRGENLSYEWVFRFLREGETELEVWTTSNAREPVVHFPPGVVARANLTVTNGSGMSDTAVEFLFVVTSCGGPDDPPGGDGSVVIIKATDDAAAEVGSNNGTWTLTRTDDNLDELVVAVSVSGNATEGADYSALARTVRFPAGSTAVTVDLVAIDDERVEPNESVTMTIEPGLGYTVGDPDRGAITIFSDDVGSGAASLSPLVPARLLETRSGESTADGEFEGVGRLAAGSVTPVQVAGRGGVDADADAVALNVTAIGPAGPGFVTLFPCDADQPTTSSLNYGAGGVAGNSGMVKLSADGQVCAFTQADTDLVLDVNASLTESAGFESLTPVRLVETRPGEVTVDGKEQALGRLAAGSVTEVKIAGRGGVADDADAAAVNVTAIQPDGVGYVTLYPCDKDRPATSSLNYSGGGAVGNSAVVSLSATGTLCIFSLSATDLVIDVNAWLADDASFDPLVPARFFETRSGEQTVDGEFNAVGRLKAKSVTPIQVSGRGDVPAGASAAALNVTAINPAGVGFITLFPCDGDQPLTSSLNYAAGGAVGNSGVVKLAADGTVCAYTQADTDLVIDVNAAWTS